MKILVTGAAGFIGSHIFNELSTSKYNVFGIDNLCRGNNNNLLNKKISSRSTSIIISQLINFLKIWSF